MPKHKKRRAPQRRYPPQRRPQYRQQTEPEDISEEYYQVWLTDDDTHECIGVRVGNKTFLLHTTNAVFLVNKLIRAINEWEERAKRETGFPGLWHKGTFAENEEKRRQWAEEMGLQFIAAPKSFIASEDWRVKF